MRVVPWAVLLLLSFSATATLAPACSPQCKLAAECGAGEACMSGKCTPVASGTVPCPSEACEPELFTCVRGVCVVKPDLSTADAGIRDSGVGPADAANSCPRPPQVTISDDTFDSTRWSSRVYLLVAGANHSESQQTMGGNPGAFRTMFHMLPAGSTIGVEHIFGGAVYDPSQEGAIERIEYSEDRVEIDPPFAGAAIASHMVLVQGGVTYYAQVDGATFANLSWATAHSTFFAEDFAVQGQEPNFSASGPAISFGYARSNSNTDPMVGHETHHAIDNWSVTVVPACR